MPEQLPGLPSGFASDTKEFCSSETLLARAGHVLLAPNRRFLFETTQRLLGFDFPLACFGKDSTLLQGETSCAE